MNLFCATLTDRFISIIGPDAIKFLQGQCSCDLNELSEHSFSYGTLNTPKGRIYCFFKVLKIENGLLLSMHESVLESTLQKLSKYAVFFKCELKEDSSIEAFGITSNDAVSYDNFLNSINLDKQIQGHQIKLNDAYWLNISSQHNLCVVWVKKELSKTDIFNTSTEIPTEHWLALETRCGIPEIYDSSQDEFILQYLNLHQLGAVSFKKGCYTGQEIIARMKFLGKLKKQSFLLHSDENLTQIPLVAVYDKNGSKCGTVVRSHWSEQTGSVALCILPIEEALSYEALFLSESLDTPFSVIEIDYKEFKK